MLKGATKMAMELYEVFIRFLDGKIGTHVEYRDPVTGQQVTRALHTSDFPALDKRKIEDVLGAAAMQIAESHSAMNEKIAAAEERFEKYEERVAALEREVMATIGVLNEAAALATIAAAKKGK